MALQRVTFAITCDTNGMGSSDKGLKLPSELTRHARLDSVSVDLSSATTAVPTITISQLDDVSAYDVPTASAAGTTFALGDQLFYTDFSQDAAIPEPSRSQIYDFEVARAAVNPTGDVPSAASYGRKVIRTKNVRCEVNSAASGDVVTVNMYYETAGDYRF